MVREGKHPHFEYLSKVVSSSCKQQPESDQTNKASSLVVSNNRESDQSKWYSPTLMTLPSATFPGLCHHHMQSQARVPPTCGTDMEHSSRVTPPIDFGSLTNSWLHPPGWRTTFPLGLFENSHLHLIKAYSQKINKSIHKNLILVCLL